MRQIQPFTALGRGTLSSVTLDETSSTVYRVVTATKGACMIAGGSIASEEQGRMAPLVSAMPCICTAARSRNTAIVCKGLFTCRNLRDALPWLWTRHIAIAMHEIAHLSRSFPICPRNGLYDASRTPSGRSGWHKELVKDLGRANPSRRIAHIMGPCCMSRWPSAWAQACMV